MTSSRIDLTTIKRSFQKLSLVFLALLLFSFPYLSKLGATNLITPVQLLGLFLGIVTWIYLDFDKKIQEVENLMFTEKELTLSEGLNLAFSKLKRVQDLRIIASSSNTISANIRPFLDENLIVENCTLIIRHNVGQTKKQRDAFNGHVNQVISYWRHYERKGIVKNLNIIHHQYTPTNYTIIIDDKFAIQGHFIFDKTTISNLYSEHKTYVTIGQMRGKDKILFLIKWFDQLANSIQELH